MPFTTQEKAEMVKIIQGMRLCYSASTKLAAVVGAGGVTSDGAKRADYATAINDIFGSTKDYMYAFAGVSQCYIDFEKMRAAHPYPDNIAYAKKTHFDVAQARFQQGAARLTKHPEMADAKKDADAAKALFDSFDWNQPYAAPFPPSYPRIVGPHGDFDMAMSAIITLRKYLGEAGEVNILAPAFSPKWDQAADKFYAQQISGECVAADRQARIMGLNLNIECQDDTAVIDAMTAAGSGVRTRDFFSTVRTGALFRGSRFVKDFAGMNVEPGASSGLRDWTTSTARVIGLTYYANGNFEGLRDLLVKGGGFFFDMPIAWTDGLDDWMAAIFLFVHGISKPPSGGGTIPDGFFDQFKAMLDKISAEAGQVGTQLKALEGTQI